MDNRTILDGFFNGDAHIGDALEKSGFWALQGDDGQWQVDVYRYSNLGELDSKERKVMTTKQVFELKATLISSGRCHGYTIQGENHNEFATNFSSGLRSFKETIHS